MSESPEQTPNNAGRRDEQSLPSGWSYERQGTGDQTTVFSDSDAVNSSAHTGPPKQYFVPEQPAAGSEAPSLGAHSLQQKYLPPVSPPPVYYEPAQPLDKRPKRSKGKIVSRVAATLVGLTVLFIAFGVFEFQRMERVPVKGVLASSSGPTNYLIVGSDSREGFDPNAPNADAVFVPGATDTGGERSDTMLILRSNGNQSLMTSVPRDLFVTRTDGTQGRINAAFRDGPEALISSIHHGVGIPIHHYVEVNFVTFAGLVDAVGGVTIDFPNPARDTHSGLWIEEPGAIKLDGVAALAYVRSRHYEEFAEGRWISDPTGDLGRIARQQLFLRTVLSKVTTTKNPVAMIRITHALSSGLKVDDSMGFFDALRFANQMRGLEATSVPLPVYPYRTSGGAAVLGLVEPDARNVITMFND